MVFYFGAQKLKVFTKYKKRALRIISDNKFNAHTETICRAERLLKVKDIYRLGIYKFYYKLINNHLPHYFQDFTPTFSVGVNTIHLETLLGKFQELNTSFLDIHSDTN